MTEHIKIVKKGDGKRGTLVLKELERQSFSTYPISSAAEKRPPFHMLFPPHFQCSNFRVGTEMEIRH